MSEMQNETSELVTEEVKEEEFIPDKITPWYLLDLLKPIIRDEFVAQCRYDRSGIRMKFCNGQKFHLSIKEIN
ncbi:MAG: hypothetical protein NC131_00525 [Roseburia sp.]|nr:hypothetical protein [Roseburia sp.]